MSDHRRKLKIKLIKSLIGCPEKQCLIVKALGLYKTNQEVVHYQNDTISGMLKKIYHLVKVEAVS